MDGLITFGTVVTFKDSSHYIFLAQIGTTTYLAKIIEEKRVVQDFLARRAELEKQIEKGSTRAKAIVESPLFCFVILETTEFNNCIATLAKPSMDAKQFDPKYNYGRIVAEDVKKLRDVIIDNEGMSKELRDYIRNNIDVN